MVVSVPVVIRIRTGKQRMSDDFEKIKKEASTTIAANASLNYFLTSKEISI